jgi:hypothetical protein
MPALKAELGKLVPIKVANIHSWVPPYLVRSLVSYTLFFFLHLGR